MGKEKFKIRPYARLLTMLGEQLIKNEKIALMELIKNSYDADADWVQVRINNAKVDEDEDKLILSENSSIEIEDDGEGMTLEILRDSWMNPATPIKLKKKKTDETRRTPKKRRIIQGEKGIGRFAIYKLGRKVEIISRSEKKGREIYVNSDFSKYDDDFLTEKDSKTGQAIEKEIYLDEIQVEYDIRPKPVDIIEKKIVVRAEKKDRMPYGTIIRIYGIKGDWSISKLKSIQSDISKLEFPFNSEKSKNDFLIDIQLNGKSLFTESEIEHELTNYFEKAPIIVKNGHFDDTNQKFTFELNGKNVELDLTRFSGDNEFKRFLIKKGTKTYKRDPSCGPFDFEFHVFDLSNSASSKYSLNTADKKVIKNHRIYLYRDQIRVYPYGDPDDDWIGLDVKRGTSKAGDFLSNDQTVGYVGITQQNNPELKDKTNREGLIEIGSAFEDFKALLLMFLGYLNKEFKKYKTDQKGKEIQKGLKEEKIKTQLDLFEDYLEQKGDRKSLDQIKLIIKDYSSERKYLVQRAEKTEDLAGVGLAVETASHDIMVMIGRAKDNLDLLVKAGESGRIDMTTLVEDLHKLRGQISFVEDQLEGIQPMFRSTKRRNRNYRVKDIVENVKKYFDSLLLKKSIKLTIEQIGSPIMVVCNEGVLMQTFINLLDNSVYWLETVDVEEKEVKIILDGNSYDVIIADNGPGIWNDDLDYIFDPFFSTKGVEGRGLGLYIVRQLLERYDFTINYVSNQNNKVLPGANFLINFKT